MKPLTIRNKNAMRELLLADVPFEKIALVNDLDQDELTAEIVQIAQQKGVRIEEHALSKMAKRRTGNTREVIVGYVQPNNQYKLRELIEELYSADRDPFFLLINRVDFESNIGVIARTAFAAGVNGLIFQGEERDVLNNETLHYSLGAIARIPLVKMGIFDALKTLQKNGIRTVCVDMEGDPYYSADLIGPTTFVLGAEGSGLSDGIIERCNTAVSIPMCTYIDSINVGVSAGVVLYEKVRQERQ